MYAYINLKNYRPNEEHTLNMIRPEKLEYKIL
jgi:hypothetical protein